MGKVIITGPGRSGTSFLMRVLTHCGMDTGFSPDADGFDDDVMGGCEIFTHLGTENGKVEDAIEFLDSLPRILKSPDFSWYLRPFLSKKWVEIDHVILPIRNPQDAARSRQRRNMWWWCDSETVESQTAVHETAIGAVVAACVQYEVEFTIMRYPDFVMHAGYCHMGLSNAVPELKDFPHFDEVFESLTYDKAMLN